MRIFSGLFLNSGFWFKSAAKVLARLCGCSGLSEACLLAHTISTKVLFAGTFDNFPLSQPTLLLLELRIIFSSVGSYELAQDDLIWKSRKEN